MPSIDNPNAVAASIPGQIAELRRQIKDLSANKIYQPNAWHVGAGGLIVDGLSVLTGACTLTGGVTGPVAATGAISSSTTLTAGTSVNAGTDVNAAGNISAATGNISGVFKNIAAYSNPITASFRNVFVTSVDGQYGFNLSSRKFKQDIETAQVSAADVLKLRLVTYRYIAAVEEFGEDAAIEHGFIAEEVEEAGLGWLVDYDEDGEPLTLKFHLIGMAMLVVAQDQERRLAELERLVADRDA